MIYWKYSQSWFNAFFDTLVHSNINSYRLVTIIRPSSINDWDFIQQLDHFAQQIDDRVLRPNLKIQIECWIDEQCSDLEVQRFKNSLNHLKNIKYYSTHQVIERFSGLGFPDILKNHPSHEMSLNILKLWSLDLPFDVNVYLDPTLWKKYAHYAQSGMMSSTAFGLDCVIYQSTPLFVHFIFPSMDQLDSKIMLMNNDFLIGTNYSSSIAAIKRLILNRFDMYASGIDSLLNRESFLKDECMIDFYEDDLEKRIAWHKKHPQMPLTDFHIMSVLSGSIFLEEIQSNLQLAALYSTIHEDIELSKEECYTKKYRTYADLTQECDDLSLRDISLKQLLLENDLQYFQKYPNEHSNKTFLFMLLQYYSTLLIEEPRD
jgi:hypothetical protein